MSVTHRLAVPSGSVLGACPPRSDFKLGLNARFDRYCFPKRSGATLVLTCRSVGKYPKQA